MRVFVTGSLFLIFCCIVASAQNPRITASFRISNQGVAGSTSYLAKNADVAYDPINKNYVVVWEGSESGDVEIYAQRVSSTGTLIGTPVRVSDMTGGTNNANFDARTPAIAYNDTRQELFVVWSGDDNSDDDKEIYGSRLRASDLSILQGDIKISTSGAVGTFSLVAESPDVVYSGNDSYLVVWSGSPSTAAKFEIFGQLMNGDGTENGSDFQISDMGGSTDVNYGAFTPSAALNPSGEYLVVWSGTDNISPLVAGEFEIFGQRLTTSGTPVSPNDKRLSFMGTDGSTAYGAFNPSVVFNTATSQYMVVWDGDDNTSPLVNDESEIFGQLFSASLVAQGSRIRISDMGANGNAAFDAFATDVSFNPDLNQFLVTWHGDDVTDGAMEVYSQVLSGAGAEIGTDTRLSQAGTSDTDAAFIAEFAASVYNPDRREHIVVWDMDDNNAPYVDGEFEIYGVLYAEKDEEPTAQPTAPVASNITSSSFTVSFTAASGSSDGYIALRRSGSSPAGVPSDHTVYSVGDKIGNDTVVFVGSTLTFNQSSLGSNVAYQYDMFSYNGVNASTNYRTTSPLQFSVTTLAAEPATQATNINFSALQQTSVTLGVTKGSGNARIVIARQGSAVNDFPDDATSYTANSNFGSAPDIGSGNRVVASLSGTENSVTVTNLSAATTYHFRVFEFNGSGAQTNYKTQTATGNPASVFTLSAEPASQPTSLSLADFTSNSMSGSFTAASGNPDGYIVIRRAGSAPSGKPVDGKLYTAGDTVGSGGNAIVVAKGSSTTFNSTGLSAATNYHYAVFSFNGNDGSVNYRVVSPLRANATTRANEPPAQPTSIAFNNIAATSMDVSWQAPATAPAGYVLVRRTGSAPSGKPVDGKTYAAGDTVGAGGNGLVAYIGGNTSATSSSLSASTVYHYAVFAFNGSGVTANYRTTSPLRGNQTSYAVEPSSAPAGLTLENFTTSTMNGVISPHAAGADGYLVLARAGSSPDFSPADGQTYAAGTTQGNVKVVYSGSTTTFTNDGLNAGAVYHYDVFAFNGSGGTINYQPQPRESSAITISSAPEALDATQVLSTSFTANWNAVAGAASYELDVFLVDNPGTFVAGYQARSVTSGLEEAVTGLTPSTSYKYRVRAVNASGISSNSLEKTVTTPAPAATFQIDPPVFTQPFSAGAKISAEVRGANSTPTVTLRARAITAQDFVSYPATLKTGSATTYEVTLVNEMADALGTEFFFQAQDGTQVVQNPTHYYLYKAVDASANAVIPFSAAMNGKTSTYEMFSIPYQLDDDDIADLFETALNGHDAARWRMFRFNGQSYVEYPGQFRKIAVGQAYWFNTVVQDFQITVTAADVVHANQSDPYELTLHAGWNQIGNPYPFNIDWDVVTVLHDNVGPLWFFKSGAYSKSNVFKPWTGAFVHADEAMTLSIPVTAKTNASGRTREAEWLHDIDASQWKVSLSVRIGDLEQVSGIGMHPQALPSKDKFDEVLVPRFLDYAEMYTRHDEFFSPRFSTDVVPPENEHTWTFDVKSNLDGARGEIRWDPTTLAKTRSSLVLIDLSAGTWVDMKTSGSYVFTHDDDRQLRIVYNRDGDLKPGINLLGVPYPNPFVSHVTIPVLVDEPGDVGVEIYDALGKKVAMLKRNVTSPGLHEVEWNINENESQVSGGWFYVRLVQGGAGRGGRRLVRR